MKIQSGNNNITKATATRAWAVDQKTMDLIPNDTPDDRIASNRNIEALQTDLRHVHMSLLAERLRVHELEAQLKSLMEKKYSSQSNIIDKLLEQLHLVIRSKMDLCESTALAIERLRIIIAEITKYSNGKIKIDATMAKYKLTSNSNNALKISEQKYENKNFSDNKNDSTEIFDNRSLEEQLNKPNNNNGVELISEQ